MADNDSSLWREELINSLDDFDDGNILDLNDVYDNCTSDNDEV